MATSDLEELYLSHLLDAGLPAPIRELRFAPPRRFRFDFAWPSALLAVEIQGGVYGRGRRRGRHVRAAGFERDREKLHLAMLNGWRVYEFTAKHILTGMALEVTRRALEMAGVLS